MIAVARAPGAAGWLDGGGVAGAAALSTSPGHGAGAVIVAALAALVPIGELAFRVALVGAVALGLAAAGVVALARALVPTAAGAGVIAAALLAVAPAAHGGDGALATALVVWTMVLVVRDLRRGDAPWNAASEPQGERSTMTLGVRGHEGGGEVCPARQPAHAHVNALRPSVAAAALTGALVSIAPALAAVVAVPVALQLWGNVPWSRRLLGLAVAALTAALLVVPLVLRGEDAGLWALLGGGAAAGRQLIAVAGDGSGVVLMFAGLVGLGLGASTNLRGAGLVLAVAIAAAIAVALASPPALVLVPLALIAAGVAPIAAAAARLGPEAQRPLIATIAAVPVALIALVSPHRGVAAADAGDGAARVAADLLGPVAAGPGVFVATEPAIFAALAHERALAGVRPDLALVPRLDGRSVGIELTAQRPVASDRSSFGTLDPRRSRLAGRGFALLADEPTGDDAAIVLGPAAYPGRGGRGVAALLATEAARREAARGHLDRAARAAGLAGTRFGGADLALLAGTLLSPERPPLFGFVPALTTSPLPPVWLTDLFGDDLAWVAGLPAASITPEAPAERRLHARWREVLRGTLPPDDPSILALGVAAGRATARMLADLDRPEGALAAATATLAKGEDAATLLVMGSVLAEGGGVGDRDPLDASRTETLRRAEVFLGRAVVADPRLIDARVVLGLVQARQGRLDEARGTWQRGLEVAPNHPELRDLLK